ncbi:MAG: hypothetical protein ABNO82_00655 [Candidatus Shikimatogenerans sp. Tder]|uniref:Uncharacterized protein n=1 Tax=Candidatus Shikimatogenerans sp. Tder TaxID=3158566 RepID=A0AAU7QRX9_9FLAO
MKNININNKILITNINKLEKNYKINIFILIKKILKRIYLVNKFLKKKILNIKINFFYKNINHLNFKKKKKKFKNKYLKYYKIYNNISNIVIKEYIKKKIYFKIYKNV